MGFGIRAIVASIALFSAMPGLAVECGGDFEAWKKGFEAEAGLEGIGPKGQQALDDAKIDPNVLKHDRAQGVFAQTFIEFSSRMVNAYRLKQGAVNLNKYASVFAARRGRIRGAAAGDRRLLGAGDRFRRRAGRLQDARRAGHTFA